MEQKAKAKVVASLREYISIVGINEFTVTFLTKGNNKPVTVAALPNIGDAEGGRHLDRQKNRVIKLLALCNKKGDAGATLTVGLRGDMGKGLWESDAVQALVKKLIPPKLTATQMLSLEREFPGGLSQQGKCVLRRYGIQIIPDGNKTFQELKSEHREETWSQTVSYRDESGNTKRIRGGGFVSLYNRIKVAFEEALTADKIRDLKHYPLPKWGSPPQVSVRTRDRVNGLKY